MLILCDVERRRFIDLLTRSLIESKNVSLSFVAIDSSYGATVFYSDTTYTFLIYNVTAQCSFEGFTFCTDPACVEQLRHSQPRPEQPQTTTRHHRRLLNEMSNNRNDDDDNHSNVEDDDGERFEDDMMREQLLNEQVNANYDIAVVIASASISVSNCTFEGSFNAIWVTTVTNLATNATIQNTTFQKCSQLGLWTSQRGSFASCDSCIFRNISYAPVYATSGALVSITNSSFDHNELSFQARAISASNSSVIVERSVFDSNGALLSVIYLRSSTFVVNQSVFSHNSISNSLIECWECSLTISGCVFESNTVSV